MILTRPQMNEAEQSAFKQGVNAADLMEAAGRQIADLVHQFHPLPGTCRIFAGKGHNGGDVLVAGWYLSKKGWHIEVENIFPQSTLAPLTRTQLSRLDLRAASSQHHPPLVILDGLLGIGASGDPREPILSAIHEINRLRAAKAAWVLAADIPSGLDAETGSPGNPCVQADATISIGFFKTGLVADAATNFVGRLAIASLPQISPPECCDTASVSRTIALRSWLPPRGFDIHKGLCGRVAVIAGSLSYTGAARLCAMAAIRAGAGLVSLFVPQEIYPILASSVIPEVIVRPLIPISELLETHWNAIAIGPGLGRGRQNEVFDLLRLACAPCVIDADALNALAGHLDILPNSPAPRLLTPHPGEMERLFPRNNRCRRTWMQDFVETYPVTLLLKGSRTIIGERNSPPVFNSTGHPGMATGGMGDVLTGVCAALIAEGKSAREAAILAAWLCGRAAERAILGGASQESLAAQDVANSLASAFVDLRNGCF